LKNYETACLKEEQQVVNELRQMEKEEHIAFVDSLESIVNRKNIPTFEAQSFAGQFYNYLKDNVHCPEAVFTLAIYHTDYFRDRKFKTTSNPFPVLNVTLNS
jgi:hypothetical protein